MKPVRAEPDFIIIGAMKAGTTRLYDHCAAHVQIGMSRLKETDYFIAEKNWGRGCDWYAGLFPEGRDRLGEASPNYTKARAFPGVPARIAAANPACRLIFLARDPVLRAESQYAHAVLSGIAVPPLSELPGSAMFDHLIDVSSYAAQLGLYLRIFPRSQLLCLSFESYVRDPAATLSEIADFLGIRNHWGPTPPGAANSAGVLSRLPSWAFSGRDHWLGQLARRHLPRHLIHRGLARLPGRPRPIPRFGPDLHRILADRLAPDAVAFRRISGLYCAEWCI